ncbi:hypothetical protein [Stigmatella aurantiaca]|uniref:Uncharacterized protein n=2 Tax=Stigmatella aurantiaca (strain DW4/3-1) TaxID=378806 RepID=E3FM74_STIAD|nr:hypothetical protein [Stigmatella aurantiaca]ADO69273.1 uncharacterized protein STAUR_1469 [Stigmatella aurantiaca DW4/3-1]
MLVVNLLAFTAWGGMDGSQCGGKGQAPCTVCGDAPSFIIAAEAAAQCKEPAEPMCEPGLVPNKEGNRCDEVPPPGGGLVRRGSDSNISVGKISTSNPTLWINIATFAAYIISTSHPGGNDPWIPVNQFCSVLTLEWLRARNQGQPPQPYGLSRFSAQEQIGMAQMLINYNSLNDQTTTAANVLGGTVVDRETVINTLELNGYPEGTQIWAGNDVHVVGFYVRQGGIELYDSNTGDTTSFPTNRFRQEVEQRGLNSFVVREGVGGKKCGGWKGGCCVIC